MCQFLRAFWTAERVEAYVRVRRGSFVRVGEGRREGGGEKSQLKRRVS